MQRDQSFAVQTVNNSQKSFRPYQNKSHGSIEVQSRKQFCKRPNPYVLQESLLEPELRKNLRTDNNFVPLLIQNNACYNPSHQGHSLEALMYTNGLLAAQLQKEYYQNYLANQFQNLSFQLSLCKVAIDQSKPPVKKLESPSNAKVIVIDDDDAHSDSAETTITEGFYCSPTIHIAQAEEEIIFAEQESEPSILEETKLNKDSQIESSAAPFNTLLAASKNQTTALIPKLNLNKRDNSARKRNPRLIWTPETVERAKLEHFMEELSKILRRRISNEQTVIALLQFFDMDIEKALSTIKRNKAEYQNLFSISLRNTRRTFN